MNTFQLDIQKFKDKLNKRAKTVLQTTAVKIDRGVVNSTPVDTGRARGGWNVGVNNVNLKDTSADKSGAKTIVENEAEIRKAQATDTIYVSNNVEYITVLEEGGFPKAPQKGTYLKKGQKKHGKVGPGYFIFSQGGYSKQAPRGMVKKTIRRFPQIVRESVSTAKRENP